MIEDYINKKIGKVYIDNKDIGDIQKQNLIKQNIDIATINKINISEKAALLSQLKEAETIKQIAAYKASVTTKDTDIQAREIINIKTEINNSMDKYYNTRNITTIKENTNLKAISQNVKNK